MTTMRSLQKRIEVKTKRISERLIALIRRRKINPTIRDAKLAWHGFKMASRNLEKFLEGTPFKLPVAGLNTIIQVAESVIDNRESMAKLLLPIGQRLRMTSEILVQQTHFETLYPTCQRFCSVLTQASSELEEMIMQGLLKRILKVDEHAADLEEIFERVDEATKNFQLELTLAIIRHTDKIEENTEMIRLRDLKPVREATYAQVKHEQCTEGTREEIITRIMTWCKNTSPQCAPVYWLSGMAGTGKSTIAYTICQQLYGSNDDARRLGASFFCSRHFGASRTRRNIIPTISYELSISLPAFRQAILHAKADASPPPLKDHIHNLLFSPWAASMRMYPNRRRPPPIPPLVVVIDALDELENGEGSEFLAELIEQAREGDLRGLKFLVTSRRDPSIIQAGKSIPPDAVCRLEADSAFVEQDINRYLRTKLLDLDQDNLAELARHASGLFIYAATAVRFIIPPSLPKPAIITQKKCLELLLTSWPKRSQCGKDGLLVDHLYEEILDLWLSPMAEDNKPPSLSILQTVVCAEESVIISDIPQLLDRSENQMDVEEVQNLILSLHAVLYVSEGRVYSYHKSFVDFMFNKDRFTDATLAERVSVTSQRHYCLASSCFRIMSSLQFNMCQLPNSFDDDDKVGDLPNRIDDNISTALRYACRHWATHFSKIPEDRQTNAMPMFQEWLEERWLFWMEAMNLIAAIGDCYYLLEMTRNSFVGQVFLDDIVAAQNLVLSFANDILKKSTPHLYVSALAASSRRSHLISLWCSKFPGIPIVTALKSKDSDSELLMVQHNDSVYAVSPSPHGRYLISSSEHRTVRLLEKATMEEVLPLDGSINRTRMRLIGFSGPSTPDTPLPESPRPGQQLRRLYRTASTGPKEKDPTSGDCCVDILTVVDGPKRIHPNKQNDALCSATHVSFSPDGSRIISASRNGVLCTWDAETGQQRCRIDTHNGPVHSAVFSPDGTRILSASVEKTVRIWDSQTGRQLSCLGGHSDTVSSASFSPDEMAIVSASHDGIVHIWNADTGKEIHRIDAHDGSVNCVCFSPDGKRIVSASDDSTVRIWDRRTGCQLYQLEGHIGSVPIASFSPDGKHVVSASSNGYIHTWYTTVVQEMLRIEAHDGGSVNLACVSPDGTRIVSASHDGALRIWDAETGSIVRCFNKAHEDLSAESVCFSPDGTRIVSASLNGIVRVLEVSTGTEIHHIIANISGGSVNSVSFSPGGTRFASASDDGTVCICNRVTESKFKFMVMLRKLTSRLK